MYTNANRPNYSLIKKFVAAFRSYKFTRGMIFGGIMLCAMLAFELFNYTTTDFALSDLLGDMRFMGLRWAMILSVAFCGMDFAGIARLFTPERGAGEKMEVWYMLGAWFLAATMNATLTWWGVSIALLNHESLGNKILSHDQLLSIVPVFVSMLVWLIRILMIGTFSIAGERLFSQAETSVRQYENSYRPTTTAVAARPSMMPAPRPVAPAPRPMASAPTMAPRPMYSTPQPAPKVMPRPTYTLGLEDDDDDEDFDQRRRAPEPVRAPVRTVPAASMRPSAPPASAPRPAPKPSGNTTYTGNAGYRTAPRHTENRDRR